GFTRLSQPAVARGWNRPRTCVNIFSYISGLFPLLLSRTKWVQWPSDPADLSALSLQTRAWENRGGKPMSAALKRVEKEGMENKSKALDAALAQIERAFGKGSIMKLGQREALEIEAISTGSLGLDIALGIGGLPKGRVVEIYGPESSGKT